MAPIKLNAVNRCALSAHTRPRITILSNVEISPSFAASAAALSRLTFCWGVSPGGPVFFCGRAHRFEPGGWIFADACGVVEVNRVASVADRGIVSRVRCDQDRRERVEWLLLALIHVRSLMLSGFFLKSGCRSRENFKRATPVISVSNTIQQLKRDQLMFNVLQKKTVDLFC